MKQAFGIKQTAIEAFNHLSRNRGYVAYIPDQLEPGIYAIFAKSPNCLPDVTLPSNGLLYIGESVDLEQRNHFKMKKSGFSTLRRSIGAILKKELNLVAVHRGKRPSKSNCECFCFADEGEQHLAQWMYRNLEYSIFPFDGDTGTLEKEIISEEKPSLNLVKWPKGHPNSQKQKIQHFRNICKDEAKLRRANTL